MSESQGCTTDQADRDILDRLDELEQRVEDQQDQIDDLEEENEQLQEENERLRERLDEVETDVQILDSRADGLHSGLDRLQERLEDGDLQEDVERAAESTVERKTPIEDVVALPEDVAERSLTENQQRARFIAQDVDTYGESCLAGRVLKAGRVGRVLRAGLDVEPHPETVSRVMRILEDLGEEDTTLRKKQGEKRIAFDGDLVDRLNRVQTDPHTEMSPAPG